MNHQPGCECFSQLVAHLITKPHTPILPRPEFCQDVAAVAFILDRRLARINVQRDKIDELKRNWKKEEGERNW